MKTKNERIVAIDEAIRECQRFTSRARAWKVHLIENGDSNGSRKGGAAKRASMDLSLVLAEMRKP